jgi:hypothetical protein
MLKSTRHCSGRLTAPIYISTFRTHVSNAPEVHDGMPQLVVCPVPLCEDLLQRDFGAPHALRKAETLVAVGRDLLHKLHVGINLCVCDSRARTLAVGRQQLPVEQTCSTVDACVHVST